MTQNLPCSVEAEKAVLCCVFLDDKSAEMAKTLLTEEDFFSRQNKILFLAVQKAFEKQKSPDIVVVSEILKEQNEFEKIGGLEYIQEIACSVANSLKTREYIKILQEKTYFRKKIQLAKQMIEAGFLQDREKLLRLSKTSENQAIATEELKAIPDVLAEYLQKLQKQRESGKYFAGLSTGFPDLDLYIGGLQEGNLIIVAARPAMGKTAFALDLIRNSVKEMDKNKIALFFSLEMDKDKIAARMFSAESSIDNKIFSLRVSNEDIWQKTLQKIQKNASDFEENAKNIFIDDTAGSTLEDIYTKCHNQQIATGKKLGLVVVDYLQIMGGERTANRAMDVAYHSMGLKNLSRQFQCPVVALSQLSRENEKRADKKPVLSDLRDSGAIEQDADIVLLLHREKYYFPDTQKGNLTEVIVAKNRNGATGVVELTFLEEYTTFRSAVNTW